MSYHDRFKVIKFSPDEFEKCQAMLHPGAYLIRLLGNRGQNVKSFLVGKVNYIGALLLHL